MLRLINSKDDDEFTSNFIATPHLRACDEPEPEEAEQADSAGWDFEVGEGVVEVEPLFQENAEQNGGWEKWGNIFKATMPDHTELIAAAKIRGGIMDSEHAAVLWIPVNKVVTVPTVTTLFTADGEFGSSESPPKRARTRNSAPAAITRPQHSTLSRFTIISQSARQALVQTWMGAKTPEHPYHRPQQPYDEFVALVDRQTGHSVFCSSESQSVSKNSRAPAAVQ